MKQKIIMVIFFLLVIITFLDLVEETELKNSINDNKTLYILSSYENSVIEDELVAYAKKHNKNIKFTYMGDLDIVTELNKNSSNYDAVWISNSMWLYMLDNAYLTSNSKSISISPVVFGIKESKAKELNLINNNVTNEMIVNLIKDKKIKYIMPSVTQTNTGATAYLGFLTSLAGNPEILTEEMLQSQDLTNSLINIFSGVERVSGDEKYLEKMFLNSNEYEAVIAAESSLININQNLKSQGREQLYLIYPTDGVAINDSTFAFINYINKKEDFLLEIQYYLLSTEGQAMLEKNGQRTWYGGITTNSDKEIFNPKWGIDTTKYLNVTKFPSKNIITKALNLYIENLRKPTHVVFCLDFSGSMIGKGISELRNAMNYILDYQNASKDNLQFSKKDKITIITFSSEVNSIYHTDSGYETDELIKKINEEEVTGATALYDAIIKGLEILNKESDEYTKTVIAMTDGAINVGHFNNLQSAYHNSKIPIYSITFGNANEAQLQSIANLSNAKVFDGKTNLLNAFKEVRGYN